MHKHVKELLGGSFVYGLSGMITSAISLLLTPLYMRIFTPADYGVLNLVNTTFFLLSIVVVFGLDNSASLWFWDKPEENERKKTFGTWAYFAVAISLMIAIPICIFSKQLSTLLFEDAQYYFLLILASAALVLNSLAKVANTWFRVQKKPVLAMVYALTITLSTIGLTILFVLKLNFGLSGIYWAQVGAGAVCLLITLAFMYKWFFPQYFDAPRLREMAKFSAPLVPAAVSFWLMNSAGSYFINHYVSRDEVGLYSVGNSIAGVITLATGAFLQAWSPFAFSIAKDENHKEIFADIFLAYVSLCSLAVLGVFLFAPELLLVIAPKSFGGAGFVAGLIGINIIILSLPQIVVIGCSLVKTNMPYTKAIFLGSIVSVILFTVLIPVAGKEGAVLATILGNVIVLIYVYVKAQKLYYIPYKMFAAIAFFLAALALAAVGLLAAREFSELVSVIIKCVLVVAFGAVISLQFAKLKAKVAAYW